mgnify:CR=1 FL=1
MMSLKTVGTLNVQFHYNACKNCRHGFGGGIECTIQPEYHCNIKNNTVECADYLSNEESEE